MNYQMKNSSLKISLYLTLLALLVLGCTQKEKKAESNTNLPYYQEATFTPEWMDENSDQLQDFHKIPDFNLINQLGEEVTQEIIEGKITVADFFFTTCPGICPKMTTNMILVQEAFKNDNDVLIMSYSVTPDYDTPEILKSYADAKGINAKNWQLLTGERQMIYDLGRKSYFVEEDLGLEKTEDEFLHTENFVLVDENKHIRGIYNGLNKVSVAQLIADIKTLKTKIN